MKHLLLALWLTGSLAAEAQTLSYQDASLSAQERAKDLCSRLTLEEKAQLMLDESPAIPRLGIKKQKLIVPVTNEGKRDGAEVVQVYIRNPQDKEGPLKTLRAFKRVAVKAGQTVNAEITLDNMNSTTALAHRLRI